VFGDSTRGNPVHMTTGDLAQVTFHFDGSSEIRYIDAPKVGDHVHAVCGGTWRVADVIEDQGRFVVICELESRRRSYRPAA
jgi:hypothetical protein